MFARQFGWTGDADIPWYAAGVVLVLTILICGALGFAIEFFAYRPLREAPRLNVLITAIGVALLFENFFALQKVFGTQPQKMPALIAEHQLDLGLVRIGLIDTVTLVLSLVLMGGLQFLVYRTKLGSAMRAVSQDPRTASLMGIPVDRTISVTFVTGSVLAAAAGFLFVLKYPGLNSPSSITWQLLGLKAFVAAVVGGIGNLRGAMVGGLLIGMLELFGASYVSTDFRDAYVFTILIVVLLVRPTGLFRSGAVEKV